MNSITLNTGVIGGPGLGLCIKPQLPLSVASCYRVQFMKFMVPWSDSDVEDKGAK